MPDNMDVHQLDKLLKEYANSLSGLAKRVRHIESMPRSGVGGGGGHTIEDEGTPLTQRSKLNFIGTAVTATDNPANDSSDITITIGIGIENMIWLWKIGDITINLYSSDSSGLGAAITAAAPGGYVIQLPVGSIGGDFAIPANVTIIGVNISQSILTGIITLGNQSCTYNLTLHSTKADAECVQCSDPDVGYVYNCICLSEGTSTSIVAHCILGECIHFRFCIINSLLNGIPVAPFASLGTPAPTPHFYGLKIDALTNYLQGLDPTPSLVILNVYPTSDAWVGMEMETNADAHFYSNRWDSTHNGESTESMADDTNNITWRLRDYGLLVPTGMLNYAVENDWQPTLETAFTSITFGAFWANPGPAALILGAFAWYYGVNDPTYWSKPYVYACVMTIPDGIPEMGDRSARDMAYFILHSNETPTRHLTAPTGSPSDAGKMDVLASDGLSWVLSTSTSHDPVTVVDSASIDFTLTGQQVTASVIPGGVDHNALLNYDPARHFLMTDIDHVSASLVTGLLKVTTGTGALSTAVVGVDYVDPTSLSSYVPYSGASSDVDLGVYKLTTGSLIVQPIANALTTVRVRDSSGSPIFAIDTINKRLGLGTETPAAAIEIDGADYVGTGIRILNISDASDGVISIRRARAGMTAIKQYDVEGSFSTRGYDGVNYYEGLSLQSIASENWDATHHGTDLQFNIIPTGSTTLINGLVLDGALSTFSMPIRAIYSDTATSSLTTMQTLAHNSSGTPAAGFGESFVFNLKSSTTADTNAAQIDVLWATATHASRKARMALRVYDTAIREGLRIEASGSAPMIGFYGGTAVVRGAALTAQLTTLTYTAPGTPTYAISDMTQTTPWGFATHDQADTVLSVIKNLQDRCAQLEARLGSATGVNLFV